MKCIRDLRSSQDCSWCRGFYGLAVVLMLLPTPAVVLAQESAPAEEISTTETDETSEIEPIPEVVESSKVLGKKAVYDVPVRKQNQRPGQIEKRI